jgi:hypothetical protein
MTQAASFPHRLILAGAMITGGLLALAVHMIGQRLGLDVSGLWRSESDSIPATAAIGWWLVATAAFVGGYATASLMGGAASGQIPPRLRQFLIVTAILLLAAAGQAATGPSAIPTIAGLLAGLIALLLGAAMAFCGAYFALRRT